LVHALNDISYVYIWRKLGWGNTRLTNKQKKKEESIRANLLVQAPSLHSLMRERESSKHYVLFDYENREDEESFVYGEL